MESNASKIDERLLHLTREQIENLIDRYYQGEKVAALIEEFKINCPGSLLVQIFPPAIHSELTCPYCDVPMLIKRVSRGHYATNGDIYCPECKHRNISGCNCLRCTEMRQAKEKNDLEEKRRSIEKNMNISQYTPVDITDLSLRDRVYLGALLRCSADENYYIIRPLAAKSVKLAPGVQYENEIVQSLRAKNIIVIHPCSSVEAFIFNDELNLERFYYDRVTYHVNIDTADYKALFNTLMNPAEDDIFCSVTDPDEFIDLWKEIALHEALEYLLMRMEKVGFSFSPGEKTIAVLKDLLDMYSVSQTYAIIQRRVSDASRFYLEKQISRQHAANTVITNCQQYAERAVVNGWEIKGFRRDFECPQSAISQFFFDRVFKIGDRGFTQCPNQKISSYGSFDTPMQS